MKKTLLALALTTCTTSALALDPMPQEAGFAGYLNLGAAGGTVESNFLAKIVGVDLSDDKIHNYDSPNETTIIIPTFNFNVGYTFANKKTRLSLGTAVESSIDFSVNTALAVRHDFDSLGSVELAGLLPSAVPVEVWKDPYLTGQDRNSTEKTSSGGRLTWDGIIGSNFELIGSFRSIDIDKERSGDSLGLSAAERKLLDREGDVTRVELGYVFNCGGGDLKVRPSVAYIDRDLDGDAMAQDGYELGVQLRYNAGSYVWLNRAAYQDLDGDKDNPIFNKANDADVYVLASEVQIPEPFGWDKWKGTVGVSWGENQTDIDFNKSSVALFAATLGRSF
jgi:hypothetical protein